VALLLEEEALALAAAEDALPPAYRSPWRRAGMLEAVAPPAPLGAAESRSLWQMANA
jgi:hypothetical protein